jgi:hypothetical protein
MHEIINSKSEKITIININATAIRDLKKEVFVILPIKTIKKST